MAALKMSDCMSVVSKMGEIDQEALLDRVQTYVDGGIPQNRAQLMAASDTLAELEDERREFMRLLRQQHPDLFVVSQTKRSTKRDVTDTPEFKAWAETNGSVLKNADGEPLVLYRGGVGNKDMSEAFLNAQPRDGYAVFASDSPYVASSYANPDEVFASEVGAIAPVYVKAKKLIEFPVGRRFDKFEFDRQAQRLQPGQVLVARQVYDYGPRASVTTDPEKLYSYPSDIYAWRSAAVKSVTGNNGAFSDEIPDTRFSRQRQVDTPEFKAWSRGLPVWDNFNEAGSDRGVFNLYHATPKDFTEFKPGGDNPKDSGPAIWLSSSPKSSASAWRVGNESSGWKNGANIMPVYARLERPLVIDSMDMMKWAREVYADREFPQLISKQTIDDLKADGYDSIIAKAEPLNYGEGNDEIIVFEPTQIKSAIGNNGQFDPVDPDIRRSAKRSESSIFGREIAPLAIKAYKSLSLDARMIIDGWNVNWHMGQGEYRNSDAFRELTKAYEPVREKMRKIYGDTVPAYRGESRYINDSESDRFLFSWTPVTDIAVGFATNRLRGMPAEITQAEVDNQVEAYRKTGIARMNGHKFVRKNPGDFNPDGPDYFYIYHGKEMITDGDNIAEALQSEKDDRDDFIAELREKGVVFTANIPVDSIAFIPVGANLRQPEFVAEYNPRKNEAQEIKFSRARNDLGFYSALARGVEEMQTKAAPAGAWKTQIKGLVNKGQVKAEEIEWTGINDWLDLQEGKVSKDSVLEYLRANGVQVEQVTLAEPESGNKLDDWLEAWADEHTGKTAALIQEGASWDETLAEAKREGHADVVSRIEAKKSPPPKYKNYTLPGGENYREVLLTLPSQRESLRSKLFAMQQRLADLRVPRRMGSETVEQYEERVSQADALAKEVEPLAAQHRKAYDEWAATEYRSNHWDQPNILAHIRVNDRTDADGNKVLFVEEIQSDWGQDGKKKGFKGDKQFIAGMEGDENGFLGLNASGVPRAPFVAKTEGWLNLALKRVITMAVDQGYDKVAFINGEQSADRYDLSKHVDFVGYTPDKGQLTAFDENRHTVFKKDGIKPEEVENYIGKEVAKRLLESSPVMGTHILEGADLKVGGEGMKTFYDKIVPNAVNELLRKLKTGAKLSDVQMERGAPSREPSEGTPFLDWMGVHHPEVRRADAARAWSSGIENNSFVQEFHDATKGMNQPGFDVTDAMREKVDRGMPLFSKKRLIEDIPNEDWLNGKVEYAIERGRNRWGVPYMSSVTGYFRGPVEVPVSTLVKLKGQSDEQNNVRQDSLEYIRANWDEVSQHPPYIEVAYNGEAWVSEGNHRIMVAAEKGLKTLPIEIRYFDGGQRKDGPLSPDRLPNPDAEDITRSKKRQVDTPEFKRWSEDLPVVEGGKNYEGGPAVFVAYHGTTHPDIIEFKRVGSPEGFLGKGPYFTTDPEDASENYAGVGPDLTIRISRETDNVAQGFDDDAWYATEVLENYFRDNDMDIEVTDENFDELKDEHRDAAIEHAARAALKGDSDGLMMKVYVKLKNPADATGNQRLDYNIVENDDGDIQDETGTVVDWVLKAREIGSQYGIEREMEQHIDDVLSEAVDGTVDMKDIFNSAIKRLESAYDDNGELLSAGQIFSEIAEELGYDGVIMSAGDHFGPGRRGPMGITVKGMSGVKSDTLHIVPFDGKQVKSATGNNGEFGDNRDITRSRGRTSSGADWDSPSAEKFDDLVYKLQDKMVDVKRVVEAIKDASGSLADDLNVYLQEELYHGRAAKRTEDFVNMELTPLIEQMAKDGLSMSDVEEYLHARHAPEANKVIASRNPGVQDLQDGGSGMKTADALNYMAALPADLRKKLEDAAAKVDSIIAKTRDMYVDYELESKDTVDAWGKMFNHYIPLQREDKDSGLGIGQGFSVKGKETKGRTGSTRKVVDIIANVALQRERAIVRGEKNRVSQSLVGLATANPNENFWKVDIVPTERVFNPNTGLVEERVDPLYKSRENAIIAKIKDASGKVREHAVLFNEEDERAMRMAAALKNLDAAKLEGLMGVSASISRYFAAVNTQYNPVFGVVNLVRDVQGALLNLGSTQLADERAKVARYTMSALRGIYGDARGARKGKNPTSAWAALWDEFQEVGGQTGYRELFRTSEDRANAIKKALEPDAWAESRMGKIFTVNGTLKVPMAAARRVAGWIFDWLSDYNLAMENGVRLAAYKAGLEKGLSKEQAASLAKNLTVNFNRKGQMGQQAGALYAFFNASVQGTARIGQTIFDMDPGKPKTIRLSPFGKKVVYGGMMLGSIQAMMMAAAGYDDEDPPDFVRERSLIIPLPDGKYVTIPMPLGFHVLPGLGRHATEFVLTGFKNPHERALKVATMMAETFNPIGNAGLSMQTLAPTALDPLVALTENRDYTGKPIARESMNKATPGHALARDTATSAAKLLSEAINTLSGGNKYVAGVFSPTPDQIDYLIGQVTGGVGRELAKVEQTVLSSVRGEALPTYKIPLAGRFVGDTKQQASEGTAFYANTERLNRLETEIKGLQKDGKFEEANELRRGNSEAYLITVANAAERQVQRLRAEKRELIKAGAPREQVIALEERITGVMARLNRAVESLREKQEN